MLREIVATRQNRHHTIKRWFTNSDMDLFVWFKNHAPVQFQLSYNKNGSEHAISWHTGTGFSHNRIDSGEQFDPLKYKMSPILLADGDFDAAGMALDFLRASDNIEPSLADFIYARLLEFPRNYANRSNQTPAAKDL